MTRLPMYYALKGHWPQAHVFNIVKSGGEDWPPPPALCDYKRINTINIISGGDTNAGIVFFLWVVT